MKAVKPMKRVDDLNCRHRGALDVYHCRREERGIAMVMMKRDYRKCIVHMQEGIALQMVEVDSGSRFHQFPNREGP